MEDSERDGASKRKRNIGDLPAIPKRQRDEAGHSSCQPKGKTVPVPDAIIRSKTNNTAKVHEDYSCRLILPDDKNGNKFLVLQIVVLNGRYAVFSRFGQEGEEGDWEAKRESGLKEAVKTFKKKFREKTDNGWNNRDTFVPQPGKYYLQEGGVDQEEIEDSDSESELQSLDPRTELLMKLILNRKMFMKQISVMKLDPKKVAPERISERMLSKAEEALTDIEKALKLRKPPAVILELWSKFFKAVPHVDEAQGPPPQQMGEAAETFLHKKKELMMILSDIRHSWNLLEEVRIFLYLFLLYSTLFLLIIIF
ncbi:protein mono-ADP-ribosyltransferase PARP3-like [Homarus americanus]|uniref:protein mono-ADP-ribosyltransferase PARP3-like n=1 Tax=Homarus americanus TaxID=6706 RepID=UPI001C453FE3|nr:protein mono-ADP-ribosyltransferase PARP3-like [Homarus americanus]